MQGIQTVTRRAALRSGAGALVALLAACGGGKSTPTTTPVPTATLAPAATTTPVVVVPTATIAPPTSVPPLATSTAALTINATPTPLAASTAQVSATGTTLSATSAALSATATTVAPTTGVSSAVSGTAVAPVLVGTPAVAVDPAAQANVDKARARFDALTALHFVLTIEGDIFLDTSRTIKLRSGDGDILRPDRVALTAKASTGPINAQLKFIQIGPDAYLTNILTGKWDRAPEGISYDPRLVFDKQNGVSGIMGRVKTWQIVENTKVGGTDTQHIRGAVPVDAVNELVSSSLRGDNVDVDLFIEPKNSDVIKFVLSEQAAAIPAMSPASKWTLDLSKQNENIKIDAPTIGA